MVYGFIRILVAALALFCGVSAHAAATLLPNGEQCFSATTPTSGGLYGPLLTLGTVTGGSGYVSATYTNVPLTGGSGFGALATITVTAGSVSSVTITNPGSHYTGADTLSAASASLGGSGVGFSVPVVSVSTTGTGFLGLLGTITGGSGGTAGTYGGVALTGGSGTNATANITVSGGAVTAVAIVNPGIGYQVGDTVSAASGSIGGVTGFSVSVSSVALNQALAGGSVFFYVPLTNTFKQTWQNSSATILNQNPVILDANGCATIYGSGTYRQVVEDASGNVVWDKLTQDTSALNPFWAGIASGTANAITVVDGGFSAIDGTVINFIPKFTNTGPATLNPSGFGAIPIEKNTGAGPTALSGGEIVGGNPGNVVSVTYSSTFGEFILTNPVNVSNSTVINVITFGADPTGSNDSAPAFNAAIAAIPNGGEIFIPRGNYKINSATTTITASGVSFQCESELATFIQRNFTSGNVFTFNSQYGSVRDCSFLALVRPVSGFEISFGQGCFECQAIGVSIQYGYNAIEIFNATETRLQYVDIRYLFGLQGVYMHGNVSGGSFGATLTKLTTDNPYPRAIGSVVTWAPSTSFTQGQITFVNNAIYQVATSGISASSGSGPSGLPSGTTPASAFTNTITDGGVQWNFVANGVEWVVQDSYGYSLRIQNSSLIDGLDSFAAVDSANTGSSYPKFDFFDDIESDHAFAGGVLLNAGVNFNFVNPWIGSSLSSSGLITASTFKGDLTVTNGRIAGNCQHGILLNQATAVKSTIANNQINSNSACTNNTYNGVTIAANTNQFIVTNNFFGKDPDIGSDQQAYGVVVTSGTSNDYIIYNNICAGENQTGCVNDGGSGATKNVAQNL